MEHSLGGAWTKITYMAALPHLFWNFIALLKKVSIQPIHMLTYMMVSNVVDDVSNEMQM